MKKIILLIVIFLGVFPVLHHGHLRLINVTNVRADDWGDEDDNNDPPDPPPCDDSGDSYSETPGGSDNCFNYTDWTDVSWDCDGSYEDSGTYSTPITTLDGASLTLSSYSGNIGDAITLTATATSTGDPGLTYEFQEFDSVDGWIDITSSSSNSCIYIIDQGGESPFRVIVTSDCGGTVTSDEEDFIAPDCTGVTAASLSLSQYGGNIGSEITLTASATPANATNVTYEYQEFDNVDGWIDIETSSSNTCVYDIDQIAESPFRVIIKADCGDPITSDEEDFMGPPCSISNVSLSLSSYSGNVGDEITLTANATTAGSPNLTYEYQEFDNVSGWIDIETTHSNTCVYDIDQGSESPFRVIITSDCGGADPAPITSDEEDFTAPDCWITGASLSLSSYSGNIGDEITLTASATTAGSPTLTYEYQEFDNVDGWIDIETSHSNTCVYDIDQGGESPFRVLVKSNCGDTFTSDEEDFIGPSTSDCDNLKAWVSSRNRGAGSYYDNSTNKNYDPSTDLCQAGGYSSCISSVARYWFVGPGEVYYWDPSMFGGTWVLYNDCSLTCLSATFDYTTTLHSVSTTNVQSDWCSYFCLAALIGGDPCAYSKYFNNVNDCNDHGGVSSDKLYAFYTNYNVNMTQTVISDECSLVQALYPGSKVIADESPGHIALVNGVHRGKDGTFTIDMFDTNQTNWIQSGVPFSSYNSSTPYGYNDWIISL